MRVRLPPRPHTYGVRTEGISVLPRVRHASAGRDRPGGGNFYLFECIVGILEDTGVWVYNGITAEELERLDEAEGENFVEVVQEIRGVHPVTMAAVIDSES